MSTLETIVTLAVFLLVYALIILRGTRRLSLPVWVSMTLGAMLLLLAGGISPVDAFAAVDFRVLGFLLGMFSIVAAMELSGLLQRIAERVLSVSKTSGRAVVATVLASGLLSTILVNDTIALLWTPVVIVVAGQMGVEATPLLVALAFGVTIGSVMTPIGNPQNLLVAENSGLKSPMTGFLASLTIPTLINLGVTALILSRFYSPRKNGADLLEDESNRQPNAQLNGNQVALQRIAILGIGIAVAGFVLSGFVDMDILGPGTGLTVVALIGGGVVYVLSGDRLRIFKSLDWTILVFFAAMFIVMHGVWDSGIGPAMLGLFMRPNPQDPAASITTILLASTVLSQILSNVPFVQLYSQVLLTQGVTAAAPRLWLAVAAGSTIAGNLTVLGAASNIIIIEAAEKRGVHAFSFFEFLKVGSLVTLVNLAVYWVFLVLI